MEARYKQWKKDIAYLKDIDAYDFGEARMISILLDFLSDEAHKEITSKHETAGHKSSTLKQVMIEVENIIQREKDRKAIRKDRKSVGGKKNAFAGEGTHHSNDDTQYAYIWDTSVKDGYGVFIMTAKRVRTANVSSVEKRDTTKHNAPKDGTSQRVYLAVGGRAYHSCTAKEKGKTNGKGELKGHQGPRQRQKQGPQFRSVGSAACQRVGRMPHRRRSRVAGPLELSWERVATHWHVG